VKIIIINNNTLIVCGDKLTIINDKYEVIKEQKQKDNKRITCAEYKTNLLYLGIYDKFDK